MPVLLLLCAPAWVTSFQIYVIQANANMKNFYLQEILSNEKIFSNSQAEIFNDSAS